MVHDRLDHDYSGSHPFLSFAKKVSFPIWNVMVGELGEKFTRHSGKADGVSNELKEEVQELSVLKDSGVEAVISRSLIEKEANMQLSVEKYMENRIGRSDLHPLPLMENTGKKHNDSDIIASGRYNVFRYCEIIREESKEAEEEDNQVDQNEVYVGNFDDVREDEKAEDQDKKLESHEADDIQQNEPTPPFVSHVKITLKRTKSESNEEMQIGNNTEQTKMDVNTGESSQPTETKTDKLNDLIITSNTERVTEDKELEDNLSYDRSSQTTYPMLTSNRTDLHDENHLSPVPDKKQKQRYRKKSSSFSGALPIRIEVTPNGDKETTVILDSSSDANKTSLAMRRRGTIDMGRVSLPKSPNMLRGNRPKRADPSHYLMQNKGKRRGSYNPTYDPTSLALTRTRSGHHHKSKSITMNQKDDKQLLRERLMKHMSPELRKSFDLDASKENQEEAGFCSKDENEPSKLIGDTLKIRSQIDSSDLTRRKISLAKSASFDNFSVIVAGKNNEHNSRHARRHLKSRNSMLSQRMLRKLPVFDTVLEKDTKMENVASDSELKQPETQNSGQYFRARARNFRAQSSFDGVSPSQLGRLRQKSVEHLQVGRSKSDSISSMSSSDGSDITDPFPMHYAAKHGKLRELQKMIASGKNVNALDADGWPAIHYALTAGNFECVACLLNAGANITDYARGRTSKYFK